MSLSFGSLGLQRAVKELSKKIEGMDGDFDNLEIFHDSTQII